MIEIEHNIDEITSRSEKVHMQFSPASPNVGLAFLEILLIDQKAMKIDFSKKGSSGGYTMSRGWIFEINV
jgi:hypothetical protein